MEKQSMSWKQNYVLDQLKCEDWYSELVLILYMFRNDYHAEQAEKDERIWQGPPQNLH